MSYYMGDYYAGDPGFFSFLSRGISKIVGLAGRGMSGAGTAQGPGVLSGTPAASPNLSGRSAYGNFPGKIGAIVKGHPVLSAAAGAAGAAVLAGRAGRKGKGLFGAGGKRRRRMRVTNTRALYRALRRVGGFSKVARRVLHFTHPRASRGRPHFRFARKRKA